MYKYPKEHLRASTHQSVAYTGTAGDVSAVGAHTQFVRVVVTSAAYVAFGATATTSDVYMPADIPEIFKITAGQIVSAIQVSAGGTLHVTEMIG
tara:strand:- start:5620 stop:5901 length:282 start_codon:yes stop_codon:yes gene_type:complete